MDTKTITILITTTKILVNINHKTPNIAVSKTRVITTKILVNINHNKTPNITVRQTRVTTTKNW